MSFILDALKKLERQKQDGAGSADVAFVEGGRPFRAETRGRWIVWGSVIVAIAALIIAGAALFETMRALRPADSAAISTEPPPFEGAGSAPSMDRDRQTGAGEPSVGPPPVSSVNVATTPSVESMEAEPSEEGEAIETAHAVRLVGRSGAERARPAEERLDPTEFEIPAGLPQLVLQGTSIVDGKPVAVVNYQRLFEGDFIEGARVIRISESVVELEYQGERFKIGF